MERASARRGGFSVLLSGINLSQVYVERATQLNQARDYLQEEQAVASATALLAVHAAIALNDALLSQLIGKPFKGEDHKAAVKETKKRCGERGLNTDGIKHLEKLIAKKSVVSYGDKLTTFETASALSAHCDSFLNWAYKRLAELS